MRDRAVDLAAVALEAGDEPREVLERLVDAEELELGPEPPDAPPRLVSTPGPRSSGRARRGGASAGRERVVHRAREQPVEQQELDGRRRVDRVLVGAQVGLVRRAAAQRRGPAGAAERVAVARRQQAGQSCRPVRGCGRARRTASRRRGSSSCRRGRRRPRPAPSPSRKNSWRAEPAARAGPRRQLGVHRVEALPHLRRDRLARAARVLPRGRERARDRAREGRVLGQERGDRPRRRVSSPASARLDAHRVEQRPADRRLVDAGGPRAGGGSGRRGAAPCPRPARRSGRSSTATPRSGSARRAHRHVGTGYAAVIAVAALPARTTGPRSGGADRADQRARSGVAPGRPGVDRGRARAPVVRAGEHPRVLRAAALARVHDQAALRGARPGSARRARTHTSRPSLTANGRRSRWRAPIRPSTYVGSVDRRDRLCAIQPARVGEHLGPQTATQRRLGRRAARSRGRSRPTRRPA